MLFKEGVKKTFNEWMFICFEHETQCILVAAQSFDGDSNPGKNTRKNLLSNDLLLTNLEISKESIFSTYFFHVWFSPGYSNHLTRGLLRLKIPRKMNKLRLYILKVPFQMSREFYRKLSSRSCSLIFFLGYVPNRFKRIKI